MVISRYSRQISHMTDATLFMETYLPYSRLMYVEAVRLLGDSGDAEDVVQDVYARLWQRRDALGAIDNKRAYVMAMVRNRCLTLIDGRPAGRVELDAPEASGIGTDGADLAIRDRAELVMKLIDALPSVQRVVITMHDVEGRPNDEIVRDTGLSADNVRQLLSRARRAIRSRFGG